METSADQSIGSTIDTSRLTSRAVIAGASSIPVGSSLTRVRSTPSNVRASIARSVKFARIATGFCMRSMCEPTMYTSWFQSARTSRSVRSMLSRHTGRVECDRTETGKSHTAPGLTKAASGVYGTSVAWHRQSTTSSMHRAGICQTLTDGPTCWAGHSKRGKESVPPA